MKLLKFKENKIVNRASQKSAAGSAKKKMPKIVKVISGLVIIVLAAAVVYIALDRLGYIQALKLAMEIQKQDNLLMEDRQVLEQLSKIIILPEDAAPTMAIITDITALQENQPVFFANAKNNDRLIVYPEMAIIYDAKANKIIKVGPVNINNPAGNPADEAALAEPVKFAILNGSGQAGSATAYEEKLKALVANIDIVAVGNAGNYYENTILVDLTGEDNNLEALANALGIQISELPEGEIAPEGVSYLIIVGQDQ